MPSNPEALLNGNIISRLRAGEAIDLKSIFLSIEDIFLISAIITYLAFFISFFMKEIPLRKTHKPALEDAVIELAGKNGLFEAKDEPASR